MPTEQKARAVEELTETLTSSQGTIVIDYRGLNVADLASLRGRLRPHGVRLQIAKNTLLRRAADAAGIQGAEALFTGPTAIAVSVDDEVAPARLMAEAARIPRTPLAIKGGIYSRRVVSMVDVRAIAELPPREVMLARVLGVVQAPAAAALSVVQAPARQVLYALAALGAQSEGADEPV